MSPWDKPGLVDRFRELVLGGKHSYSHAADILNTEFGTKLTRNAAIGRAQRMGLQMPKRERLTTRVRRLVIVKPKKPTLADLFGVVEDGLKDLPRDTSPFAKSLLDLRSDQSECRWPVETPDGEMQLFCADAIVEGRPYCVRHCLTAYRIEQPLYVSEAKRAA